MAFSQIVRTEWYAQFHAVLRVADDIFKSQNQPLGPDCEKYVTMTPKAPPDIDKWVIDPMASNTSSSTLTTRDIFFLPRNPSTTITSFDADSVSVSSILLTVLSDRKFWVVLAALSALTICGCGILTWLSSHIKSNIEAQLGIRAVRFFDKLLFFFQLLLIFYILDRGWQLLRDFGSWSATSKFLEACRNQEVYLLLTLQMRKTAADFYLL
jgi:hypothetical protein